MNEKKWLQATLKDLSDEDITVLLKDPSLTDESLLAGIEFARTYLSKKAAPSLLDILKCNKRSIEVRRKAANALAEIDSDAVRNELILLSTSSEVQLSELAALALEK